MKDRKVVHIEERTARLTVLIDPRKKAVFDRLCAAEDVTPSQVVRRMIRGYIEERLARPWAPREESDQKRASLAGKAAPRRRPRNNQ